MVCTEGLDVNRMEVLDILCVAVGGTIADGLGTARRPALWQILLFINDVMLSTRQSPLLKTIDTPAGSAEVLPRNSECEQDTYVLERFDLPSDLISVMSGRDLLNNKLEGAYSLAVSYGSTSVDPTLVPSVGDISGVRGSFSGTSDHLETIRPDEHPASTPLSIHSGRLTVAFEQGAYILERFDSPSGLSTITSGRDMLDEDLEAALLQSSGGHLKMG